MWLWLSNGTLQIQWFGTKFGTYEKDEIIIFCPKMEAMTLVMPDNTIKTYKCSLLNEGRGPTRYVITKFIRFRNISQIFRYFTYGWLRGGILSGSRMFSKNYGDFKSPRSGFFPWIGMISNKLRMGHAKTKYSLIIFTRLVQYPQFWRRQKFEKKRNHFKFQKVGGKVNVHEKEYV